MTRQTSPTYRSTAKLKVCKDIDKGISDAYRIYHLRNLQHTRQSKNRIGR